MTDHPKLAALLDECPSHDAYGMQILVTGANVRTVIRRAWTEARVIAAAEENDAIAAAVAAEAEGSRSMTDELALLQKLVADLSCDLTDEGGYWSNEGMHHMRVRVANALPDNVRPDWLTAYRTCPSKPEPPAGRVRVRVLVATWDDGSFLIPRQTIKGETLDSLTRQILEPGYRLSCLTADVPLPSPPETIEAEVE